MKEDAVEWVKKCTACQKHRNLIYALSVELHSLKTPYPFHTSAMDFVGPIAPPSQGKRWILAVTENFTKWVEVVVVREATTEAMIRFLKENIICRFGLPHRIVSDNGTQCINQRVATVLDQYHIQHHRFSPYYPQANRQAESTNKSLIKILTRMVDDAPKEWSEYLPLAL